MTRLASTWALGDPEGTERFREIDGTLGFFDISGFTTMAERLSRLGRHGAEVTMTAINTVFEPIIQALLVEGGDILKFGGDAVLALFEGDDHATRSALAAAEVQRAVGEHGRIETPLGPVRLRLSAGLHTGRFCFTLTNGRHRELLIFGPDATVTTQMEAAANAGQVLVSAPLAAALPPSWVGARCGPGRLLRRSAVPHHSRGQPRQSSSSDVGPAVALIPPELIPALGRGDFGEHRPLAMAFLSLPGTDELLGRHDPDAVVARIADVTDAIDACCVELGVTWLKSDIGANQVRFLLTAGVPELSEGDDERILRSARSVVDRCRDLKVGVNTGTVFVAEMGHPRRRAVDIMGDAPNLAARLMARAEPGEILVHRPMMTTAPQFGGAPLEPFTVKGKRRIIHASRLGSLRTSPIDGSRELTLVGRDAELDQLLVAMGSAQRGRGHGVLISGEPGLGKSRLVSELRRHATDEIWLEANADLYESLNPYHPIRVALRSLLSGTGASSAEVEARLGAAMRHDSELRDWGALLGPVLGIEVSSTPNVRRLDASLRRNRTFDVVIKLLDTVLDKPTVIAIGDAHWLDDASAELVQRLVDAATDRPWLVLITSRPEGRPLDNVDTLHLQPLDEAAALALAIESAGDLALDDTTLHQVRSQAGGNPLFLRELARGIRDASHDIPTTVERLFGARIDQLAPPDRQLLRDASVAGTTVRGDLLADALADPAVRTADRWQSLQEFISLSDDGVVRFHHDLMRVVAYEGLAHRRRRDLHGKMGDALARVATYDAEEEHAAAIARHYRESQQHAAAWRWARIGAEASVRSAAWVEAADLYGTALAAAARVPSLATHLIAEVAEALGDVCERLGRHDDSRAAYKRWGQLVGDDPLNRARLLRKQGRVEEKTGRYTASLRRYGRALRVLEPLGDDPAATAARIEVNLAYSVTRFFQGKMSDSIDLALAVLPDAERINDRHSQAQAHLQLEMACSESGLPERAEHGKRAQVLFEELGDDLGLGNLYLNLGVSAYNNSGWNMALEHYRRSCEAYRRAGDVVGAASTLNNEAEILTDQGRYGEASERLAQARRMFRAARYELGVALTTSGEARLLLRGGDAEAAIGLLDEARRLFVELGATNFVLDTDVRRVECLVFARRSAEALALADTVAAAIAGFGGIAIIPITLQRLRACALAQLGRLAEATEELTIALAEATTEQVPYEQALTMAAREAIAAAGGPAPPSNAPSVHELIARLDIVTLPAVPA